MTPMVTVPAPVPVPGECHSQVASWLMPQRSALLPVLLMVKVWAGGLLPPCCAVKDRLVGVMPMVAPTGASEGAGAVGDETSCAKLDISADIPRIVRPPAPPLPDGDGFPIPAAASGIVSVGSLFLAVDPEGVADGGVMCTGVRGEGAATLLGGVEGSLI